MTKNTESEITPQTVRYLDDQGRYQVGQVALEWPVDGTEAAALLGFLERQRATFAWKVSGLDEAGLRVSLGQSQMTLGGMLKHLARFEDDMSHEWVLGQGQLAPWNEIDWANDHAWDWRTGAQDPAAELYTRWQEAVIRSRGVIAQALTQRLAENTEVGTTDPLRGLRHVLVNMIEEYARHNGHADLIREAVDGLVGHDPPQE